MDSGDDRTPERRTDGGEFPQTDDLFGDTFLVGTTFLAGVALVAAFYPAAGPTGIGVFLVVAGALGALVERL